MSSTTTAFGELPPLSNGPKIMVATVWALNSVAILAVSLRMIASCKVLRKVSLADHTILLSIFFRILTSIFITISAHYGLGQHIFHLDLSEITNALKWQMISEAPEVLCPMFGRISFCVYLLKLVGTCSWQKWILHVCIWFGIAVNLVCIVVILGRCSNIQALYDFRIQAKCWSLDVQHYYGYFQGGVNTLTDLCLTILPVYIIYNLQMARKLKTGLYFVLGLSILASVATIVKTIGLKSLAGSQDITYSLYTFVIWSTVENVVVVCCASVPCIRPLFVSRQPKSSYVTGSSCYSRGTTVTETSQSASKIVT